MKTGDTVRFLNAVGGGVISRIDSKTGMVYVEDADGFEIPTLMSDCVVIGSVSAETNFPRKVVQPDAVPAAQAQSVVVKKPEPVAETADGDVMRAFLAFFPVEIKQLQTTSYDCYLVNDSNYYLFYNLVNCNEGNWKTVASGTIEPNMQEELCSVTKDQLNSWEEIRVQLMAFKMKAYTPQVPVDAQIKMNVIRFFKLHSFVDNDYFEEPALMVDIVAEAGRNKLKEVSAIEIKQAMYEKEQATRPAPKLSRPHRPGVLEVDLHIDELVDTTAGMSNADMLQLQMDTFHRVMAENRNKKGQKIVFIHGKGEGVLRSEIEKMLKSRYKTCYFQDASFREYGFGATMVTIK